MLQTHKLGNATFEVRFFDDLAVIENFTGECQFEIKREQLAHIYRETDFALDHWSGDRSDLEYDPETDDPDEEIVSGSADSLIVVMAAAASLPARTYQIDYHGLGAYWFFHDLIHAEYDTDAKGDINITIESEMRALPMGAVMAAQNGVSIEDIIPELLKAQSEFEQRFGSKFDAITEFLTHEKVTVKVDN